MGRRIRTRLYFTSESHLHTVLNVFRFAQIGDGKKSLLSYHGRSILNSTPELCYLTQVVMRVFEDNRRPIDDPRRFRMEILFSPGATATPMHMKELDREQDQSRFDTAPLQQIGREGLTCQEVEDFFEQAIMAGRSDEESYEIASSSTAAEHAKKKKKGKKKDVAEKLENVAISSEGNPESTTPLPLEEGISDEIISSLLAVVETTSPSTVEDLSVAPDLPPAEPPISEMSGFSESNDLSACISQAQTQDTVRVKNHFQHKTRQNLTDLFPASVEFNTANGEDKMNGNSERDDKKNTTSPKEVREDVKSKEPVIPDEADQRKQESGMFSRKYFWGTVAVASFGVGISCIAMALTMSNGERRPRRWSSSRAY